jgi:translation initiation factor IF-2
VGELANRMAIRAVDVIKFMMRQGIMLKINDVIDTTRPSWSRPSTA